MSRFGTYLENAKLMRLHVEAAAAVMNNEHKEATFKHNIVGALRSALLAMNNLSSMQFKKKLKNKKGVTMKNTIKKALPLVAAVLMFTVPAGAWEFERNPDRFVSVGLNVQNTSLSGESSTSLPGGAHAGSTDNEVRARAIGADIRIPVHQSLTLSVSYEKLKQNIDVNGFSNTGAPAYIDGNDQSGQRFGVGVRYYLNK